MKKITALSFCFLLFACQKNSGNVSKSNYKGNLTANDSKKWVLTNIKLGATIINNDCQIGDIYEFNQNGTLVLDVVDSLCDPRIIDPQRYTYGSWNFFSNNDSINLVLNTVETHWGIATLTSNLFQIEINVLVTDTLGNPFGIQKLVHTFNAQ